MPTARWPADRSAAIGRPARLWWDWRAISTISTANPVFSNNTNTLSDGVTPFTISQSLTTDYLATVRPRIGIARGSQPRLHHRRRRIYPGQLHGELYRRRRASRRRNRDRLQKSRRVGPPAQAGNMPLPTIGRCEPNIFMPAFPKTSALGAITDAAGGSNALRGSSDVMIQLVRAGVNFKF